MDKELFYDILRTFGELSGIPAFVINEAKVEYTTLREGLLDENAIKILGSFDKGNININIYNNIEYFASMPIKLDGRPMNVVLVAFRSNPITVGFKGRLVTNGIVCHDRMKEYLLSLSTVRDTQFVEYADMISRIAGGERVTIDMMKLSENPFRKYIDEKLVEYVFETRENELDPYAPEAEQKIMDMVKAGDVENLKKINLYFDTNAPGLYVKYLFKIVALVTVVTRAVMESGVDSVKAYGLSDQYLVRLGNATTDKQVYDIARSVLPHFAELVQKKDKLIDEGYSPHLIKATKYIKTHLHFPLSLSIVAENIGVSEKYLSRLFVKYKKEKFTAYVNRQRVSEAKELLVSTDRKLIDIAYSLAFVSESYFIKVFEDITGVTPQKYRNQYKMK